MRVFHSVSTLEAQQAVDTLVERKLPIIWEFENTRRVLDPNMGKADQTLLLLHAKPSWVSEKDLIGWVEYSNTSVFREKLLGPLHKSRLIEYDKRGARARISPLGVKEVESRILKTR